MIREDWLFFEANEWGRRDSRQPTVGVKLERLEDGGSAGRPRRSSLRQLAELYLLSAIDSISSIFPLQSRNAMRWDIPDRHFRDFRPLCRRKDRQMQGAGPGRPTLACSCSCVLLLPYFSLGSLYGRASTTMAGGNHPEHPEAYLRDPTDHHPRSGCSIDPEWNSLPLAPSTQAAEYSPHPAYAADPTPYDRSFPLYAPLPHPSSLPNPTPRHAPANAAPFEEPVYYPPTAPTRFGYPLHHPYYPDPAPGGGGGEFDRAVHPAPVEPRAPEPVWQTMATTGPYAYYTEDRAEGYPRRGEAWGAGAQGYSPALDGGVDGLQDTVRPS